MSRSKSVRITNKRATSLPRPLGEIADQPPKLPPRSRVIENAPGVEVTNPKAGDRG